MPFTLEQNVGPILASDGNNDGPVRAAKTGELVLSQVHGRYHEAASRGRVFNASMQAGAALGTALTATAVTLTLYNPLQSGVLLSLIEVTVGMTAPLNAAGNTAYVLAANVNPLAAAPSATTAATVRNALLGGSAGIGVAYTAATLPAAPVIVASVGGAHLVGATPVSESTSVYTYQADGKILLAPNTAITLQGIGTATSGIVSMFWEEIPIV